MSKCESNPPRRMTIIEEMSKCEKCVEYVEQTKRVLQERAINFDAAQRLEQEACIRDAVKGNDMWNDIHCEIENNLLFLMQHYLPEDKAEQFASEGTDQHSQSETEDASAPPPSFTK